MSEKKIVVPEGMLDAACDENEAIGVHNVKIEKMLAAALRWLSENPIVPSDDQCRQLWRAVASPLMDEWPRWVIEAWQRRMFLAPEPEIPEEVKDLLADAGGSFLRITGDAFNTDILEAFHRGQKSR